MPDTLTANYELVKPEINGSPNTWGNKLNGDMDILDTQLKRVDDLAMDAVLRAGSGVDPDDYIRAVLRYQETVVPSNDRDLTNVALLKAWITNASPIGIIQIWGGTVASIPTNWALCDGSTVNGNLTPNLTDRFIVGAGGALTPGSFGGTSTHNHTGNTGGTAITEAQMPYHTHHVNDPGHAHSVGDPGHSHGYVDTGMYSGGFGTGAYPGSSPSQTEIGRNTSAALTGIFIYAAATGVYLNPTGGNQSHIHTISSVDHRPPYYALAYIMRVKYPWDA